MPPKKKPNEPSKKTEQKVKAKIVEDKTFGLKNKKGSKQQKFIQHVQVQVTQGNKKAKELEKEKEAKFAKKDEKKKLEAELNQLFKPVMEQKVQKGVDPKSVLCAFFKAGQCTKGDKCKFSHDINVVRKTEKRNMYEDARDGENDNMETWDAAKLEEVINKKHGESDEAKPKTAIICKFFLDAVESNKYGWFWECPNGETCIYRHALPPGFVLKKDKTKDDKEESISLEELVESERAALSSKSLTKVTLQSFLQWKERKRKEKIEKSEAEQEKKRNDYKSGKIYGISGREMFEFNPDLVAGDDEEAEDDATVYKRQDSDEETDELYVGPVREIDLTMFARAASEVDGSGTIATSRQFDLKASAASGSGLARGDVINGHSSMAAGIDDDDDGKLGEATGGADDDRADADTDDESSEADGQDGSDADMPIDENLFDGEDIFEVENELENLEVRD